VNAVSMAAELRSRLACESSTPFGCPVEPEVYWMNARSSGPVPGSRQCASAPAGASSVLSQGSRASSAAPSVKNSLAAAMPAVVSRQCARASTVMPTKRGSVRWRRSGSGGYTGTAVTPV
jgi:hypothetical protein